MKKILLIFVLVLFWVNPAFAFNYLFDLGLSGTSGIGGAILGLLIVYGAFFGTRVVKSVIWGWIMFFVTFGYVLWLFQPDAGFVVLMFFAFLGEKEKKKEHEEWVQRDKYLRNKVKKKRKKRRK
jgi:hypothetical protein